MSVSDVMILSQVWQRLMLLSMQPMAWMPMLPQQDEAPVKAHTSRRRPAVRRR